MKNLTIEQQKEFEKMVAEINRLHQENDDLIKSHNKEERRLHSINKKLIKEISYEDLKEYLSDESSIDVTLARRLYLLERSIPRRQGDTHTWLERLKIFADTSTLEHSVIAAKDVLGKKLYFTRKSGDHEALHYGAGSYAADFYYWDDVKNKAVFVEFKHWRRADIESAKEYYKDKIYSASNVIVCTGDRRFYWIDYAADIVTEIDNIVINDKFTSKDKAIDDGVLLALIDTFSSYAVMFLSPKDDYKTYLSLSIKMTSFNSTNSKRLTIKVSLEKKFDRNILLNITVSDPKGNIIKRISHLKRRIASKL